MYKIHQQLIYSPSDLCRYMDSPFASWMERYRAEKITPAFEMDETDPMLGLLQKKGEEFEAEFLTTFESEGKQIAKIDNDHFDEAHAATLTAMKAGADVIYQAALVKVPFQGYADFLIKVPGESQLGDYHYEVWDTKLSQHPKAYFFIQLCSYAEMLDTLQGRYADEVAVVLGNGEIFRQRLETIRYYYDGLKSQFLQAEADFDSTVMPDPADSKSWGRWEGFVKTFLESRDDISQVATITKSTTLALKAQGITTMGGLAETSLTHVPKVSADVLERLVQQAKLQVESKGLETPAYQVKVPQPGQRIGLALLPPPSPMDVFFDIEGYPLMDGGLEYLWGNTYYDDKGVRQFKDFWAHDHEQEKQTFKAFIEWVYGRWQADPTMHIYHYASYEVTACRKLMTRYGVCEDEVDNLLRHEVFVDLYKIVSHGLIVGEPRYSIKNIEHLYRGKRETDVTGGGESVAVYEQWRNTPDGETWEDSEILKSIRDYNIDDCESTEELVVWLRDQCVSNAIDYVPKPAQEEIEISEEVTARLQLADQLLQQAEVERESDPQKADITELFAWLLDFIRRQNKPVWWRMFDRMGLTDMELLDDLDCVAMCQRTATPPFRPGKLRTDVYEYQFDAEQELKPPSTGTQLWIAGHEDCKVSLHEIDIDNGIIQVKSKEAPPDMASFIPLDFVNAAIIEKAIEAVTRHYAEGQLENSALLDFLNRRVPRIYDHTSGTIIKNENSAERLDEIIDVIARLNNSYLCIQGPPGTGKTYTGSRVISALVQKGKRIGITSNSHKAINNLLMGVAKHCKKENIDVECYATKNTGDELEALDIEVIKNQQIEDNLNPGCVIGTTAWGFSREELANQFDYLFVDEAGQVSVAYLVAMSPCASNIVIKGDQMQLGQPVQGSHPGESGASILEYLLEEHATIPEDLGIFLGVTYRMHPNVNEYISDVIYEGRLVTDESTARQQVIVPDDYQGPLNKTAGIIYIPVEHQGNTQASQEEAEEILTLAIELLGRRYIDIEGKEKTIGWEHMLFVAPYNHQVSILKQTLGDEARVGSVDKFQGQEAPIVFYSLSVSDVNDSPRGIEFVFNKNRLNVAISRAQALAIVVGNPGLAHTNVKNIGQIESVNLISRLMFRENNQGWK